MNNLKQAAFEKYEEAIRAAGEEWFENHLEQLREDWDCVARKCESPIESILLAGLCFGSLGYNLPRNPSRLSEKFDGDGCESLEGKIVIVPQAEIAGCRVDFAVYAGDLCGSWVCVAVECDGHNFHEKTKEQAARDKSRDRALVAYNVITLRFTGSEIYNDHKNCVEEISSVLSMLIDERLHLNGKVEATGPKFIGLPAFNPEATQ